MFHTSIKYYVHAMQVSLDCRIDIDYGISTISKAVESIKRHKVVHFFSLSRHYKMERKLLCLTIFSSLAGLATIRFPTSHAKVLSISCIGSEHKTTSMYQCVIHLRGKILVHFTGLTCNSFDTVYLSIFAKKSDYNTKV